MPADIFSLLFKIIWMVFYDLEMKTLWLIQTDIFLASFEKLNSNQTHGENVEAFSLNPGIQ